jgi:hypothetical protein
VYYIGTSNATKDLQSVLVFMMDDIKGNIIVRSDECLFHTKTENNLLATLKFFFNQCQKNGLKLHANECVLSATMGKHCGRLITKDDVPFVPKHKEALQTIGKPQNGADLAQNVAAVNWMRSQISNY